MLPSPLGRSGHLLSVALLAALAFSAPGKQVIIPRGSIWKYLDDGSDQGSEWIQQGFDDSAWASGRGQLGYGEGDEDTRLSFGSDPRQRNVTAYFRHSFNIPAPSSLPGLRLEVLRDDGMVVYLNGTEVGRSNMPEGEITFDTFAASSALGSSEKEPAIIIVAPELLRAGPNTIAVEVHQDSRVSSDLSFDLEANDAVAPSPPILERALLGLSRSGTSFAVTHLELRASDCDSVESDLTFAADGVEAGRFELASAPGVAVHSFTQSQVTDGQLRFVPEELPFSRARVAGTLEMPQTHDEISGLVASIQNPGILWAHEDSDNPAALIALGADAGGRGEWTLGGPTNVDWEDIATASVGGRALLYIGDFGDNGAVRDDLRIYRVLEPMLAAGGGQGGVIPAADIETIEFQYPATPAGEGGGSARDAESMIVDPHSGDIYILTKREAASRLFRLAHAASYTGVQTLEYLGDTPAIPPDSIYQISSSSTAADISRDGLEVLVRNYRDIYYFKRQDLDTSIAEMLLGDQVEELPSVGIGMPGGEPTGESICFDAAGDGFYTIGETPGSSGPTPLFYYRRLPPGAPPAFSVTVSDGALSDGPHPATVLIDPAPMEIWRHQNFDPTELADAGAEGTLWGELADPDRDGRPNLVEYALGTDPRRADASGIAVSSSPEELTLTYQRDIARSDVTCEAEASTDLRDWGRIGSTLVGTAGNVETRRANIPTSTGAGSTNYLRLRITSIPPTPAGAGPPEDGR